ncbi:hypothetical protein V1502_18815 [Bacillus sp. SCS-153A]|uniref:hypothetical protein n=1 Tax=Rossellomorea sedimentorum TaxID=3115294 RepID=UPI003905B1E9
MEDKEKIQFDSLDEQFLDLQPLFEKIEGKEVPKLLKSEKKDIGALEDLLDGKS